MSARLLDRTGTTRGITHPRCGAADPPPTSSHGVANQCGKAGFVSKLETRGILRRFLGAHHISPPPPLPLSHESRLQVGERRVGTRSGSSAAICCTRLPISFGLFFVSVWASESFSCPLSLQPGLIPTREPPRRCATREGDKRGNKKSVKKQARCRD